MKKCEFCGAEMEDELTVCPACEKEQHQAAHQETPAAQEEPAAETAAPETAAPVEEAPQETEATPETPVKKGITGASAVALAVAAVVLVAAIVAVLILSGRDAQKNVEVVPSAVATEATAETQETEPPTVPADGNPEDVTCKGTYTVSDEQVQADADKVVATSGANSLTNAQLQVHYWLTVQNFYAQYGTYAQYLGLDHTQSMDTQVCAMADGKTWQQYFLDQALSSWKVYEALAQQAQEAGFQMPEESQTQLDELEEGLLETATNNGFADIDAMLKRNFGPAASLESYKDFLKLYFLSSAYYDQVTSSFDPTEEEIAEFFNAHEAEYAENGLDKTTSTVDVRHILILPEGATTENVTTETFSDEAWAASEKKAQELLDQWLAGDKTEDSFATLANENSADGGSNTNGGLYTDVSQGQMVEAFDDWCFDESRQAGDYGIVKTQFGYHIMYFCGSQTLWQSQARQDLISQQTNAFVEEALAASDAKVDYSAIELGFVDMSN